MRDDGEMSLFDKLFNRAEKEQQIDTLFKTLNAYTPVFVNWRGSLYESELVRAAIEAKAEHISKMRVEIRGAARPKLQTKLKAAPNEFQTWSQFLKRLATIYEVNNTAFIVPVIDEYGETTGVYPVLSANCDIVQYQERPYLRYRFLSGDCATIELDKCGILTKHQYKSEFFGENNSALDNTMALINIQNQGITEGVKSAATYRFMAQLSNFSKPEDLAKERKRFNTENLSADSGGGVLLFPNTYSNIKQIDSKPFVVDAEQMKLIQTNVFNYFGVNERILQNSANGEELDAFYNGALEPFAVQLAEVLTKMLFTLRERSSGAEVYVTSNRLQYMSAASKMSLITTMGDRGMITINEARELLNYAPVEGGDALMPIRGEYYNAKEGETNND